jgi:hypothetical protein
MYGVVTTVQAPVEMYDRMHAELIKRAGTSVDDSGLMVHVGRATADGFERFEVWESKEHYDRAMEISGSLSRELAGDLPDRPLSSRRKNSRCAASSFPAATS